MSMKFSVPMIWKEQQNHVDDCYFCLAHVSSGINRYIQFGWVRCRKLIGRVFAYALHTPNIEFSMHSL